MYISHIVPDLIPILVECLKHTENTPLQFEAAWALTNIASTTATASVVEGGALPVLVTTLYVSVWFDGWVVRVVLSL
jgi:hypothetical protein